MVVVKQTHPGVATAATNPIQLTAQLQPAIGLFGAGGFGQYDTIGFRGPYGNWYPTEAWEGKNLIFLGGGIAPPILPELQKPAFLQAFLSKGRMRTLLEAMPVRVILDDGCGLHGAARHAALRTGQLPA